MVPFPDWLYQKKSHWFVSSRRPLENIHLMDTLQYTPWQENNWTTNQHIYIYWIQTILNPIQKIHSIHTSLVQFFVDLGHDGFQPVIFVHIARLSSLFQTMFLDTFWGTEHFVDTTSILTLQPSPNLNWPAILVRHCGKNLVLPQLPDHICLIHLQNYGVIIYKFESNWKNDYLD